MKLTVKNISFSYNGKPVLKDIDFAVKKGEILAILGKNGSGKSTLIKNINNMLIPKKGVVCIDTDMVKSLKTQEIAQKISYMPQKTEGVSTSVFESILLGRKPHIRWDMTEKDYEITDNIIKLLEFEDFVTRDTTKLSGGEFQKMLIARALVQEPEILLLDEPINHLDVKNQLEVMHIITHATKKLDMTTIIVMHDLNMAMRFATKFLMLKKGEIVAFGGKEVISPENIKKVYDVNAIITEVEGVPLVALV